MSLDLGVYAWIGINFVLGRFNHVENGKYLGKCLRSNQLLNKSQCNLSHSDQFMKMTRLS